MRISVQVTDTDGDKWVKTEMKTLSHHVLLANIGHDMTSCEGGRQQWLSLLFHHMAWLLVV